MGEAIEQVQAFVKKYEEDKKVFIEEMKRRLSGVFKEFFQENPEIKKLSWSQYTPYFNDGEECTFSVNMDIAEFMEWEKDIKITPEIKKKINALEKVLRKIPDEIYKDMFKDRVEVTATPEGFKVKKYEHD